MCIRDRAYDNYETTDDHGMQIYGIAKDQEGNEYYMVTVSYTHLIQTLFIAIFFTFKMINMLR